MSMGEKNRQFFPKMNISNIPDSTGSPSSSTQSDEEGSCVPVTNKMKEFSNNDDDCHPHHSNKQHHRHSLWYYMIHNPWPFLIVLPVIYSIFIYWGWFATEDIVEDEIIKIGMPFRDQYAKNLLYTINLGITDITMTTLAAMALSRDGTNIFTAKRLEEIRTRMEETEKTTVTHKGITYTWDDLCAQNPAPYELPCARLSPMDYFYEARWYFDNGRARIYWYDELIKKALMIPTFGRFGILATSCSPDNGNTDVCADLIQYRTVTTNNSVALLGDVRSLEMSDDCRICIEDNYQATIIELHKTVQSSFTILKNEIQRYLVEQKDNISGRRKRELSIISNKLTMLIGIISYNDIEEFYFYYSIRYVYAELGYKPYTNLYNTQLSQLFDTCHKMGSLIGLTHCPPLNITEDDAKQTLLNHADNVFSNISTSGAPFPMWSAGDGTGSLFAGTSPVSGSGINMSASVQSIVDYLDIPNYNAVEANTDSTTTSSWAPVYGADGYIKIASSEWESMVETNPLYAWFMASLEPAYQYCGNGYLTGTKSASQDVDNLTQGILINSTQMWCNEYSIPNIDNPGTGNYTKQYFAKMWYDRLLDSSQMLNIQKGYDDPYSWTTGTGCGYKSGGSRNNYTNMTEESILYNASRPLYFYDEGVFLGPVSPELILGDVEPNIHNFSSSNPLQKVGSIQTVYAALVPSGIISRVQHCKRPGGAIYNLSQDDAHDILYKFKEAMELAWSRGWNDPEEDIQFVCFFDDAKAAGTAQRLLREITMNNSALTALSIALIAIFSIMFMFSFDVVESRVLISIIAVTLVVLGYYAALGFAIVVGIKINVTIAWTLPFIIMGLGVDDMYIVLMALKNQKGFGEEDFLKAMKEVVVPVTMTSLVNASMFAILNISDIPAIYLTARVAVYAIISLYLGVIFCFPAYCYFDMKRQAAGRSDVFVCNKRKKEMNTSDSSIEEQKHDAGDFRSTLLYDKFYQPLVLNESRTIRTCSNVFIMGTAIVLFVVGCWGITKRKVGMGLEDLLPMNNQAGTWATQRTESMASWNIEIRWGDNDYTDPNIQMQMIKQFEDIVATSHTAELDTKQVWIAEFTLWASRVCESNVGRTIFDQLKCGHDQVFLEDNSVCSATWKVNTYGLRQKIFSDYDDDTCDIYKGGICRPITRMHPDDISEIMISNPTLAVNDDTSFCPTIDNWSNEKWQFCLLQWRNLTGSSNGRLIVEKGTGSDTDCDGVYRNDLPIRWPIKYSTGPLMYAYNLISHEETLKMIDETRQYCDFHETIHCWMTGIPYAFWSQYETVEKVLFELCAYSTAIGFLISFIFLYAKLRYEGLHDKSKVLWGSSIGASLITVTCVLSLVTTVGCSVLAGVKLTSFSNMSFVLSVGFSVEYSVHIVSRWLRASASKKTSLDRVRYTMSFLMMPSFMSFVSSTIGVVCLTFTEFQYIEIFYFRPLIIVMFVTYFFGCWWLPPLLTFIDFEVVKLGKAAPVRQMTTRLSTLGSISDFPSTANEGKQVGSDGNNDPAKPRVRETCSEISEKNGDELNQ